MKKKKAKKKMKWCPLGGGGDNLLRMTEGKRIAKTTKEKTTKN